MEGKPQGQLFSGAFFSAIVAGACLMSLAYLPATAQGVESPNRRGILQGSWTPLFEKSFGDVLPAETASRELWGGLEYAVFHEGRKGVVVGDGGWLFTTEEFSCPPGYAEHFRDNMAYIQSVRERLAQRETRLAVVIVPAKARVMDEKISEHSLPFCRRDLYDQIVSRLESADIPVADVLHRMKGSSPPSFLKTDTHWSPDGARLAAAAMAEAVQGGLNDVTLKPARFSSKAELVQPYKGDLLRYVPGVSLSPDMLAAYQTNAEVSVASAGALHALFDDEAPSVTLVGTSYSANPNWNFVGFLKESLKTDVLNMADEGQGPFAVMDSYLAGEAWKSAPPLLVVWEMPERYFLMPHGVAR